ncbi:MAG: ribosomal protein S18-alanine N-acetyltransferase [Holosporaceae bacterium]|jgi:ribosomal-protein-alanine N-acetyltransferase|nr:ribosomal protein S18-alanine N-acetyltransferase [Holosporaceae bacterium]
MIRKISASDSELLAQIHGRCFGKGWSAESFRDMLLADKVFFGFAHEIDSGGEAVGFILCKAVCEEAEIVTFGVLPHFRNIGVGGNLVRKAEEEAEMRSAAIVFLEVSRDNATARKLYENLGYEAIAKRRGYYKTEGGAQDATVMRKNLFGGRISPGS